MPIRDESFTSIVRAALAETSIVRQLRDNEAVILERIARGGGATKWYYCRMQDDLAAIENHLSPGSIVSCYFDARIRHSRYSPELAKELEAAIEKNGEIVAGTLRDDGTCIDMAVLVSRDDLSEFILTSDLSSELFYGVFPGGDNDGRYAVTLTLPDSDGIVRSHPH